MPPCSRHPPHQHLLGSSLWSLPSSPRLHPWLCLLPRSGPAPLSCYVRVSCLEVLMKCTFEFYGSEQDHTCKKSPGFANFEKLGAKDVPPPYPLPRKALPSGSKSRAARAQHPPLHPHGWPASSGKVDAAYTEHPSSVITPSAPLAPMTQATSPTVGVSHVNSVSELSSDLNTLRRVIFPQNRYSTTEPYAVGLFPRDTHQPGSVMLPLTVCLQQTCEEGVKASPL